MYYHAQTNTLYRKHQSIKKAGLSSDDVISVVTKEPESFNVNYEKLDDSIDIKKYNAETNTYTFDAIEKKGYVIFGKNGNFKQKGWSPDAVAVPLSLHELIDENYKREEGGRIYPPSDDYLDQQIKSKIMTHAEALRAEFIALTKSGERQREWWSGKEDRAKALIAGTITDQDLSLIQREAGQRKKSETNEQLAEKQRLSFIFREE